MFEKSDAFLRQLQHDDSLRRNKKQRSLVLEDGLACVRHATGMVEAFGLFADNEDDMDEVSTSSLKYLLLPCIHANLLLIRAAEERESLDDRLEELKQARILFESFLRSLLQYRENNPFSKTTMECISLALKDSEEYEDSSREIVSSNEMLNSLLARKLTLSDEEHVNNQRIVGTQCIDAATKRQIKVQKFKLAKSIKEQLKAINEKYSHKIENKERYYDENDDVDQNEDLHRKLWFLQLESAVLETYDCLDTLDKECEILQVAEKFDIKDKDRNPCQDLLAELGNVAGCLQKSTSQNGAANDPNSMHVSQREIIQRRVFRPTHILPTISVEKAGEMELKALSAANPSSFESDEIHGSKKKEDFEHEILKSRAWDDWKDDNPRGWGNRALRNTR